MWSLALLFSLPFAIARSDSSQFVGNWEGAFKGDHGSGAMTLGIAHDSIWTVNPQFDMGGHNLTGTVRGLKFDGNDLYFVMEAAEFECQASATLDKGELNGELDCGHATLQFALKKGAK
jgi:hypothetical protein